MSGLPDGWAFCQVGESGEVLGGRQRSPHIRHGEMVPYLRVANVLEGRINFEDVNSMYFSEAEIRRYRLRPGDILLNEGQSINLVGRSAMFTNADDTYCFQNTLIRYRAGEGVDANFAAQLFSYCQTTGIFSRIAVRTNSIAHLGVSRFSELEVPFPPLPEQRKIAEILRTWDDAIASVTEIQKLRSETFSKQAGYLLGSQDQDDFDRQAFRLGELFAERNERGADADVLLSVTQSDGIVTQQAVGRKDSSSSDRSKYKLVLPGDIAYNTMRMWQGASGLSDKRGVVSPAYTVISPRDESINPRYAANLFKTEEMKFVFERYSQGLTSDTWNLKFPAFARIEVRLPSVQRQGAIAAYLDETRHEIETYGRLASILREQKRGLMQKLLTGQIRVTIDDVTALSEASLG